LAISLTPVGASSIGRRSPTKMEFKEVMNMGIMEELLSEKGKEAVMDDDSEPSDIGDCTYKEWLEEGYLKEWNNGNRKES
jgi:hypothetical protein